MFSGGIDYKKSDRVQIEIGGCLIHNVFCLKLSYIEVSIGSPLAEVVADVVSITVNDLI
jgi:hypothetical protein